MKRLLALMTFALAACGSLDNEPLRTGVIRGQLANTDASALVAVVGREELVTRPDAEGRFELSPVPLGSVELLVVINSRETRRLTVEVGAASIVELGAVASQPSGRFEVYVDAPGRQRVTAGEVTVVGTPLRFSIRGPENEAEFRIPPGCYDVLVTVPGLGSESLNFCVEAGEALTRRLAFPVPDGSPGREGCSVTGCEGLLSCQADRSCR